MKKNIILLFGGTSGEAEVSLNSAKYIYNNISDRYNLSTVFLSKDLNFYLIKRDLNEFKRIEDFDNLDNTLVFFLNEYIYSFNIQKEITKIDLVLSMVHGETGEDGRLQGFFDINHIKYSGCNIASSSLSINKHLTKIFLANEGIPVRKSFYLNKKLFSNYAINSNLSSLKFPLIIKPTSLGSSIGISKVNNEVEFLDKLVDSLKLYDELMIEEFIDCREIECAIVERDFELIVSEIGEIVKASEIYSYEEKYIKDNFFLKIPADLSREMTNTIKEYSRKAFCLLNCSGYARVDFFIENSSNLIFFNEINTIPGFTNVSMFPKLLEYNNMSPKSIIDIIIRNTEN